MKRFFAFIMAVVIVFSLTACMVRKPETTIESPAPEENIPEIIEEDISKNNEIIAGVFWYDFSDAFLSTVRDALDAELTEIGINFTNYDADGVQETQNEQIDTAISQGANLLIVNIVDTADINAAQAITDKAKETEIPVIFFNREIDDDVINSYENACFVGTRAAETGEAQGQMAGEYIIANYEAIDLNADGYISYILMHGGLCCGEPQVRAMAVEYADEIIVEAGYPSLIYYDANNIDKFQICSWSKTTAFEMMEVALSTNPIDGENPIEVVFSGNDDMALGSIEALNNVGWNNGDATKTIPVFGIDYTSDAAAAIDAGKMAGSILQSATGMAATVADLVENVINGEHVFEGAASVFNVDENANKIRVPYEIKI